MSPELEQATAALERKVRSDDLSDQRRIIRAMKQIGADAAAEVIERIIARGEMVRREALDDIAFVRRASLK
jgi:hypothetical protein